MRENTHQFSNKTTMEVAWPTCLAPRTTGTMHSGSVAWVLSSIRIERNCILASLGSPAPTHVQQMTSAFWGRECVNSTCYQVLKGRQDRTGCHSGPCPPNNYKNKLCLPDSIHFSGCSDTNF